MDIFVLDRNLQPIEMIDDYSSVIWAKRYWDFGDCEIYVGATQNHVASLIPGNYITRSDDDMVCVIRKVELKTSAEDGDYLIVTGKDVRSFMDQRVVWTTTTAQGSAEGFIRQLISDALINAGTRTLRKANNAALLMLDSALGLEEEDSEQVSYKNLGEKVREVCKRYGWGTKMYFGNNRLRFTIYVGSDLSSNVVFSEDYGNVVFSEDYGNLISSQYANDYSDVANVALVGGQGEGSERALDSAGTSAGVDRYEVFIDARQESREITWAELIALYPETSAGGYGSILPNGSAWIYNMSQLDLLVYDSAHLARLQNEYPGGIVLENIQTGQKTYRVTNQPIADMDTDDPDQDTTVRLRNIIYKIYLVARGYNELAGLGPKTEFGAEIDVGGLLKYKRDYNLGDIVGIKNEYGISITARITEVIEYDDDTGYHIEPTLEYLE